MSLTTRSIEDPTKVESHSPQHSDTMTAPSGAGVFRRLLQPIERMSTTRANSRLGLVADFATGGALLYTGVRSDSVRPAAAIAAGLAGLVLFSFVEYCFHRWLFHGPAEAFREGHHKHHQEPRGYDSLPFFFAPIAILLLAGLLDMAAPMTIALLLSGGFAAGYAAYGLSHTVIHGMRFRHPLARRWAALHHIHHFHPDRNFGVTTPLWDIVLKTRYVPARTAQRHRARR